MTDFFDIEDNAEAGDEYPLSREQEDRAVALAVARDILLVQAGQYAERPLDSSDLILIASWILHDMPGVVDDSVCNVTINVADNGDDTRQWAQAAVDEFKAAWQRAGGPR